MYTPQSFKNHGIRTEEKLDRIYSPFGSPHIFGSMLHRESVFYLDTKQEQQGIKKKLFNDDKSLNNEEPKLCPPGFLQKIENEDCQKSERESILTSIFSKSIKNTKIHLNNLKNKENQEFVADTVPKKSLFFDAGTANELIFRENIDLIFSSDSSSNFHDVFINSDDSDQDHLNQIHKNQNQNNKFFTPSKEEQQFQMDNTRPCSENNCNKEDNLFRLKGQRNFQKKLDFDDDFENKDFCDASYQFQKPKIVNLSQWNENIQVPNFFKQKDLFEIQNIQQIEVQQSKVNSAQKQMNPHQNEFICKKILQEQEIGWEKDLNKCKQKEDLKKNLSEDELQQDEFLDQWTKLQEQMRMILLKSLQLSKQELGQEILLLADSAKKNNHFNIAQNAYKFYIQIIPNNQEVWYEYASMEAELGNLEYANNLLGFSLKEYGYCEKNLLKYLKISSKLENDMDQVRQLLWNVPIISLDKCFKIYLEVAFLELKKGSIKNAELIFYTLKKMPSFNGQLFYEYAKFLKCFSKNQQNTLKICEEALAKRIKSGNIWSLYLQIEHQLNDKNIDFTKINQICKIIPKESIWRLFCEEAEIAFQKNQMNSFVYLNRKALLCVPQNMLLKAIVLCSRLKLKSDHNSLRSIIYTFQKILNEVPVKQQAYLYLELSKYHEFGRDIDEALKNLLIAKKIFKNEWKVYMEYIAFLMRNFQFERAKLIAQKVIQFLLISQSIYFL